MVIIWCEISCSNCGSISAYSGYYSPKRIKALKEEVKRKEWSITKDGNILCSDCQKKIKTSNLKLKT